MIDAYTIGITLALNNGVSEGLAAIRRDLDALDRGVGAAAAGLARLRQAASGLGPDPQTAGLAAELTRLTAAAQRSNPRPLPAPADQALPAPPATSPVGTATTPASVALPPVPQSAAMPDGGATRPQPTQAAPPSPPQPLRLPDLQAFGQQVINLQPASRDLGAGPGQGAAMPDRPASLSPSPPAAPLPAPVVMMLPPAAPPAPVVSVTTPVAPAPILHLPPASPTPQPQHASLPSASAYAVAWQSDAIAPPVRAPTAPMQPAGSAPDGWTGPPPAAPQAATYQSPRGAFAAPAAAQPSMAPPPSAQHAGPGQGDVFLDGAKVGRWMATHLARAAGRPQSGITGFDPRLGLAWPGAPIGS